jgi:hypothetical protein
MSVASLPGMNDTPSDVQDDARRQAISRLKAKRDFKSFLGTVLFFSGLQAYGPHRGPITEAEIQREIDKGT